MELNKGLKYLINSVAIKSSALRLKNLLRNSLDKNFPKWHAARLYKSRFGRKINWQNPTEFNEKLRWMQFNADTSKWTLLSDKYRVREYLEKRGYGDILVKLYGVWSKSEDIDFSNLPDEFVLKTNHGCGSIFIVKDKSKADIQAIKIKLDRDLASIYGIEGAEPHYFPIRPVIIAEELLQQDGEVSTGLIDYKFFCVNGEPQFCAVMYNRDTEHHQYYIRLYDMGWNDISHLVGNYSHVHIGGVGVPMPKNLERMIQFCRDMCKDFPFVRMDFYETHGKMYFGEFTFTPAACTGAPLSPEACEMLSKKMKL